ncbi:uncharacterized protein LOC127136127 [Lathyrus oleraceus]|uniref:uncharacterized protein LOC127136127 n=1 Tax=Pisum sativum TaxID=3888 RepID=UPI0021CF0866|nr:uncharacterized protein LOC127136127 [Pisum sativum]
MLQDLFYASQPDNFSDIRCDIPKLIGDNYKVWKERILLYLGWMDIDYAIRKDEPPVITDESTPTAIALYEHWERSNRLSVMFIKTKVTGGIRGFVDQHENVRDFLKVTDDQFVTSEKTLEEERLVMEHSESAFLTSTRGKNKAAKTDKSQAKGKFKIPPQECVGNGILSDGLYRINL